MISGLFHCRGDVFDILSPLSRKLLTVLFLPLIFFLFSSFSSSRAEAAPVRYPIVGIHSGYNYVGGYFQEKLTDGASLGIFCVPWMWSFVMIDTDLTWSYIHVEASPDSYFMSVALTIGPLFRYSPAKRIDLFGGIIMRGSYLHFHGANTGSTARAFKIGFGVAAGSYINIYRGIDLRITYRFSQNDLSTRTFMSHEVLAGVSYAFALKAAAPTGDPQVFYEKVKARSDRAKKLYEEGKFRDALAAFEKVQQLDPEHREAGHYSKLITSSLDFYKKGAKLKRKGDLFGAVKMFMQTDRRMTKARRELEDLRKRLQKQVKKLESDMVRLYNMKKYIHTIRTGEKILLVDPKNRKASLYIQRARKRYNALRKFQ